MKHAHHTLLLLFALGTTILVGSVYLYMRHMVIFSVSRAVEAKAVVQLGHADKMREQDIRTLYESSADGRLRLPGFFVPAADQAVALIEEVEKLGTKTGGSVEISAISADKDIHLQVEAVGSWVEIMKIMTLAENLPYASVIHKSAFAAEESSASGKSVTWRLVFDLSVPLRQPSSL